MPQFRTSVFSLWYKTELTKPVQVKPLNGYLFTGDNNAILIGVELLENGEKYTISSTASIYGYVIREDNSTVTIQGTVMDGKASIVLPSSACAVPGKIGIVIKYANATIGAFTGFVYRTTTNTIVDPGSVVPSVSELLELISDCQAAVTAFSAIIDDTAGNGATGKVWSADKSYDETSIRAKYTDVYAGCTEYTPSSEPDFYYRTFYHEKGTKYICKLKGSGLGMVGFIGGSGVYHLPTSSNDTWDVYTLMSYIDSKAPAVATTTETQAIINEYAG